MTNNIMVGNSAGCYGDGFAGWYSKQILTNNTFVGNTAGAGGGGIYCDRTSDLTVSNTIFWNNDAPLGPEIWIGDDNGWSALTISYSDLDDGQASIYVEPGSTLNMKAGMIDADPLFVDPADGDYHLLYHSPCRDAGDASAQGLSFEEFECDPRCAGPAPDMGADEFHAHLYYQGDVVPGGTGLIKVSGTSNSYAHVRRSTTLLDPPYPTPFGDLYLGTPRIKICSGIVLPEGYAVFPKTVPPSWIPGDRYYQQALVGGTLTNVAPLTVQ